MSNLATVEMTQAVSLKQLQEAITLLNQHQPNSNLELVVHETPQAIKGWQGANWQQGVHLEIVNTGTVGTIGILLFDPVTKNKIAPATTGKLGTMQIVGDHIYMDAALGQKGTRLRAACNTVVGMAALKRQGHQIKVTNLDTKTNVFNTVLAGV